MKEEKSNSLRISGTAEQLPTHFCPRRRKDFFSRKARETDIDGRTKCAAQNPQGRRNKPNLIHGYGSRHSPQLLRILNGECHLNKRLLPCPPKRGVRFPSVKSRQTGKNGRDASLLPTGSPFSSPPPFTALPSQTSPPPWDWTD